MNSDDDLREFMQVLYRALMMVARWLERKYGFGKAHD